MTSPYLITSAKTLSQEARLHRDRELGFQHIFSGWDTIQSMTGVRWGHVSGILPFTHISAGLPGFRLPNIWGSFDGLGESATGSSRSKTTCLWDTPLPTKKQENTSFSWLRNCFFLRLCKPHFSSTCPVLFSMGRALTASPADGCCSRTTAENRVNRPVWPFSPSPFPLSPLQLPYVQCLCGLFP